MSFKEFLVGTSIIVGGVTSIFGLMSGAMDAKSDKCNHSTIASYHPAYILSCELFKKRF